MLLDRILKVIDRSNRSTPKQRGKERGEGERGRREGKERGEGERGRREGKERGEGERGKEMEEEKESMVEYNTFVYMTKIVSIMIILCFMIIMTGNNWQFFLAVYESIWCQLCLNLRLEVLWRTKYYIRNYRDNRDNSCNNSHSVNFHYPPIPSTRTSTLCCSWRDVSSHFNHLCPVSVPASQE